MSQSSQIVLSGRPLTEFLMWSVGQFESTHGDRALITHEILENTYRWCKSLGRRLSLDVSHCTSDSTLSATDRVSIGTYDVELRAGGTQFWASDIVYGTEEFAFKAATGQFGRYSSSELYGIGMDGNVVRDLSQAVRMNIMSCALTDRPATINAPEAIMLSAKPTTIHTPDKRKNLAMKPELLESLKALAAQFTALAAAADHPEPDGDEAPVAKKETIPSTQAPTENPDTTAEVEGKKKEEAPPKDEPDGDKKKEEADPEDDAAKLSCFKRLFSGKTSAQVEGEVLALRTAATELPNARVALSMKTDDADSAKREANFQLAVSSGRLSPKNDKLVKQFKAMSPEGQAAYLETMPSLFSAPKSAPAVKQIAPGSPEFKAALSVTTPQTAPKGAFRPVPTSKTSQFKV